MTDKLPIKMTVKTSAQSGAVRTILIDVSTYPILADPENRFAGQPFMFGYLNSVQWFVLQDYGYRTKTGDVTTVQCSFVFNFADIPFFIRLRYPPAGDGRNHYGIASMWHDWLLQHKKINGLKLTRQECDDLFYEIMLYLKVDKHTALIMYRAVQLNTWQKEKRGIPFHAPDETKQENAT